MAAELVVEAKPPEQDLHFTIGLHFTHERDDKPLGICCDEPEHPRSLPECFVALVHLV
jgi:hypothetical protein